MCQGFDRAFSSGNWKQFGWLVGIFGSLLFMLWLAGLYAPDLVGNENWRVVELMLDPGSFAGSAEKGSPWFQLLVTFVGAIVFTSFSINTIGNVLSRRIENVARGRVVYDFEDHILILGAYNMVSNILSTVTVRSDYQGRDIVILTDGDVEKVRERVLAGLPDVVAKNVYVVYGSRSQSSMLKTLNVDKAASIYILGEDDEHMHDALNLEAWRHLRSLCASAPQNIICYLVLERLSTEFLFHSRNDSGSVGKIRLVVINSVENAAQRVLVSRELDDKVRYPALDRNGIGPDSDINVHFVIVGMTQMAYAMATTAAHICHFPNFNTKGRRTKITFVMNDTQQEMDFFKGHFSQLMDLSYSVKIGWDAAGNMVKEEFYPKEEYLGPDKQDKKGFLDIEWEFIDAGVENEHVRDYIRTCVRNNGISEYLTLAVCGDDPESNVAAALYLPQEVAFSNIPVFVYQNRSGEVLSVAEGNVRFNNLYPFGVQGECYDHQFQTRLERAMRIHCIYKTAYDYKGLPDMDVLEDRWFDLDMKYIDQQSNIYAANGLDVKFRSLGVSSAEDYNALGADGRSVLVETEHNRWNVERLLMGVSAYPYDERSALNARFMDPQQKPLAKKEHNATKPLRHKDIAPFSELLEESRAYDACIVDHLADAMKE